MARIEGVNLPTNKRIEYALTYLFGIGLATSQDILNKLKIDFDLPDTTSKIVLDTLHIDSLTQYRKFNYLESKVVYNSVALQSNFIELAMTFIILATALSKMNFKNVFASAIKYIGTVSYSVYLVHFAVLYMLTKFGVFRLYNQQQWRTGIIYYAGTYCVVLLCSVIIATITYRLVELPAQKFGKKLIERLEKN